MLKKILLTDDEVKHIASLARLVLSPKEVQKYQKQLVDIFNYINLIGQLKTEKVKETSHPSGSTNVFRKDVVDGTKILSQEQVLSNAPRKRDGYFVVKAIFD